MKKKKRQLCYRASEHKIENIRQIISIHRWHREWYNSRKDPRARKRVKEHIVLPYLDKFFLRHQMQATQHRTNQQYMVCVTLENSRYKSSAWKQQWKWRSYGSRWRKSLTSAAVAAAIIMDIEIPEESGRSKCKRVLHRLGDTLNGCLCGVILNSSSKWIQWGTRVQTSRLRDPLAVPVGNLKYIILLVCADSTFDSLYMPSITFNV